MGPHVVAVVKLKLLSESRAVSPLTASLLWTFVVKLGCSFKLVRRNYVDMLYASRLFFFQLGRILLEDVQPQPQPQPQPVGSRFERAVRLVCQRLVHAPRSPNHQLSDQETLHTLSMIAL